MSRRKKASDRAAEKYPAFYTAEYVSVFNASHTNHCLRERKRGDEMQKFSATCLVMAMLTSPLFCRLLVPFNYEAVT